MTKQDKTLATITHVVSGGAMLLSAGMVGWLVPLIIFFVKKKESRFVAYHALQSVFLHVALFIAAIICGILALPTLGLSVFIVLPALGILGIVAEVFAAMRANEGKWFGIPFVGQWTRNALGEP